MQRRCMEITYYIRNGQCNTCGDERKGGGDVTTGIIVGASFSALTTEKFTTKPIDRLGYSRLQENA